MDTDFWYCSDVSSIDLSNLIAFPPLFLQTHQIRCNSEVTVKAFFCTWRSWFWSLFGLCNSSDTHSQVLPSPLKPAIWQPGYENIWLQYSSYSGTALIAHLQRDKLSGCGSHFPATENKDHDSNVNIWVKPLFLQYFFASIKYCVNL